MRNVFNYEELSVFLPAYLASNEQFQDELGRFTNGRVIKSLYSFQVQSAPVIFQGDGLKNVLIVKLPDAQIQTGKGLVLSNTCDMDVRNKRIDDDSMLIYAPIFDLTRYQKSLERRGINGDRIKVLLENVRRQVMTQIFYLPAGGGLDDEGIVFLDRVCSCNRKFFDHDCVPTNRIFSLSDFGHYLFLFKLSIHFTRLNSQVERGPSESLH